MTSVSAFSETPALPEREPPLQEGRYRRHGPPADGDEPQIIVGRRALAEIAAHSNSQTASELGGVLLGRVYRHVGQQYVEIEAALPAPSEDRGPFHFTFNADVWAHVNREREAAFPGLQIVGWFHTHPGLGVFFSGDDVVVHSAAFVMPWHIALVVDPLHNEAGFFGWQGRDIVPLAGCYELTGNGESGESAFPWRLVRANVWDETFEGHLAQRALASDVRTALPGWPSPGPWLALAAGLAALFIALVVLIAGILPLVRQNRALQAAALPLLEERLAVAAAAGAAECPNAGVRLYTPAAGSSIAVADGGSISITGLAALPDARRYRLELRPSGGDTWYELGVAPRTESLGELAAWDTTGYVAGAYELRLTPLNRQGSPLPGAAPCTIQFALAR
ncbi:MAG: Mov34/MPN/PAD-1 family protein [Anaerolineae bacterium]|nr:Mov34/MPN/PAD-1 family protein [Anaerolineae bacterium]